MPKFLIQNAGTLTEQATVAASAGAGDAGKVPELNGSGVLALTIVNGKNTSAGAGDAGKLAALNASGFLDTTIVNSKNTSAGAGDAGKLAALDASGKLDITMMPTGLGPDTAIITTSEALAAGDLVNVWNSTGAKVRKADGTTAGKEAHGFVLAAYGSAVSATVYFEGTNTGVTGLTPGPQFLSGATAGLAVATAPTGAGKTVQRVGYATSATSLNFDSGDPITLA